MLDRQNASTVDTAADGDAALERVSPLERGDDAALNTETSHQHVLVLQRKMPRGALRWLLMPALLLGLLTFPVMAQQPITANGPQSIGGLAGSGLLGGPENWTSPEGVSGTLQVMLLLTVLSIAPALLLMTTSFVRIVVVLGLLRQALGTGQLPPSQVITAMTLFMTFLIMMPVWDRVRTEAITPYTNHEISLEEAEERGLRPIREFMEAQIERTGNTDDIYLFLEYIPPPADAVLPQGYEKLEDVPLDMLYKTYDDVPLRALLPAFMLSELKTSFLIGFQIYLPFLVLDMVVSSVMISMGMFMLPPVLISLPFKLLLFVLVDGWRLIVGMLLESFQPYT
ncbi:MAG: flagellar type III secretion system pore protein FliP [Planctomycetia bacterium]|nr:flagellar type III secretion system pore protein FliP [Planctomycetia bacterium]